MNPQRLLQIQQAANPSLRAAATPASILQGGNVTPQFAGINPQGNNYNPQAQQINYMTPVSAPYQLNPQVQVAHPQPIQVGRSVINQTGGQTSLPGFTPGPSVAHSVISDAGNLFNSTTNTIARIPTNTTLAVTNLVNKAIGKAPVSAAQIAKNPHSQLYSGVKYAGASGKNTQLAGDVAQAGLLAAGPEIDAVGGAFASPFTKLLGGSRLAGVGGKIIGTTAAAAPVGAAFNTAAAVSNGSLSKKTAKQTAATGFEVGGALGAAGAITGSVLGTLFSPAEKRVLADAGIKASDETVAGENAAAQEANPPKQSVIHTEPTETPAPEPTTNKPPKSTPAEAQVKETGVPSHAEPTASAPKVPLTSAQEQILRDFPNGLDKPAMSLLKKQGFADHPTVLNEIKQQIADAHAAANPDVPRQAIEDAVSKGKAPTAEPIAKAETQKAAQETTGKVASEAPISDAAVYNNAKNAGVSDELASELQKVVDAHNTPVPKGATGGDVAKLAAGRLQEARARAEGLSNEITKELSASEQKELRALAEGEITADQASPAVRAVYEALKPVNNLAGDTLNELNGAGTVEHYFPREAISGLKTPEGAKFTTGEPSVNTPGIQRAKDLFGIGDKPANSLGRSIYRFVGSDGTVLYGTPGSTGMSGLADGTFEKNGEIFKREHAPQSEIENSGVVKYNQNEAKVLGNYHGNVLASSSRHQLLENIKNAPDVRPADQALAGDVPIKNVPELEKYVTTLETAKAIEASPLAQSAPKGLTGTVFNKASRFVIQSIVANPIFHGGNQEFNAIFSAAWQMPGNKFRNIANIVKNQAEFVGDKEAFDAARTDYFNDGGHSPSYGKDYKGFITQGAAKVFGDGATKVTKISANSMAAIEENIRVAAYQSARAAGQTGADAVKTIDRVLGGQDVVKDMESTTGLFLHYLKTNVKNIGKSGAEALQGNVAPVAGLALGYGAWFAANKALQAETGYTLRAPGAAGVINQFAKAPGQVGKGEIPSVVRNHINPLISFGAQAGTNRDFTKPITSSSNQIYGKNKNELGTVAGRTLFGPGQGVQDVASGKQTAAQAGLAAGLGVYAPYKATSTSAFQNGTNTGPPKTIADLQAQNQKTNRDFIASLTPAERSLFQDKNGNSISYNTIVDAHNKGIVSDDQFNHYLALEKTRNREMGNTKYQNQALDAAHASGKIDDQQYNLTKAFEQKQANLTTEGKNAVAKRGPDATQQAIADYINKQLPPGLSKLEANPDLAKTFASFTKATATNLAKAPEDQETPIDYQDRTIKFWAQVAKDGAPSNVQSVYRDGGNKAAMFLKQGKATKDDINQAVGLDNMLLASGIITTPKFSKKWRADNGYPAAADFMEGGAHYGTAGVGQYLSNGNNSVVATGKGGSGGGGGFGNGNTAALGDGSGVFSSVNKKTGAVSLKAVPSLNGTGTTSGVVDPDTGLFISKPTGIKQLLNTKDTTFKSPGINLPALGKPQNPPKLKSFAAPDVRGAPRPQRAVPIRFQRAKFN